MRTLIAAAACAIATSGCSAGADKTAAESGVAQFRQQLAAGQYHAIYAGGTSEFRQTSSEEAGTRFLQMVHERLGPVRQADQTGWRVNFTGQGNVVSLGYSTQFARGRGAESFVFRVNEGRAQLMGYHINSMDLINAGAPSAAPAPADAPKP